MLFLSYIFLIRFFIIEKAISSYRETLSGQPAYQRLQTSRLLPTFLLIFSQHDPLAKRDPTELHTVYVQENLVQ